MKVKELIERLKSFPQESEVLFCDQTSIDINRFPINGIEIMNRVALKNKDKQAVVLLYHNEF